MQALFCALGHDKYNTWHKLLFTCNDCIIVKGCSEVLLIEDMQERIQTYPVTMSCKVLQQWTQSRYSLITPHIYSEEINSVMKYEAGIHASPTVRPVLLILQMSQKNHIKVCRLPDQQFQEGTQIQFTHMHICAQTQASIDNGKVRWFNSVRSPCMWGNMEYNSNLWKHFFSIRRS